MVEIEESAQAVAPLHVGGRARRRWRLLQKPVVSDYSVGVVRRLRSTVVIVQHATNPLTAANAASAICSLERLNQLVTDALVVPLGMVVDYELGNRASKMSFPEQDHPLQALLLDRPNESLCVRVAVGCTERCPNEPHSSCSRNSSTPRLHFRSRSQINTHPSARTPSIAFAKSRMA
jgi:hypothetical protein